MKRLIGILTAGLAVLAAPAAAQDAPEKTDITIGLPVTTSTFLPLYMADEEGFFEEEGINVEIVAFRGGTDMVRGMVAGAVDIGVTSLAGVSVGIAAEQPLKVFYGGFNMAVFDWYAVPEIDSMANAKGKRFGVTRIGSSTDFLTRHALQTQGLDPDSDVQIIQGGGSVERLAAMEAGQIDVNIFATPEKFMAADAGFKPILKQTDIAPDYPFHVFFATKDFIQANPNTIRAVLRGFVKGVRLAKADKDRAIEVLVDRVGMEEDYAGRGYDDFIDKVYEDGRLPSEEGMQAFWEIGIESGEYEEAWPEERYFDPTFVDTYEEWKPAE
ncbi:ABC transporter substrate-binding protein [Chelativorans xinjiangense]|uniref:ABC transporter substrate-binding protein n=1 Tax=Chelativorans xinjiangense TaxID=2681485 RepID=UPI001356D51B|nr:ABC transporter substrate-binding protein [Chelativorans xinjiangense]